MADVTLSDIVDVEVYRNLPAENAPELTAYFESGVVVGGEYFDNLAAADGRTAELIFWRDLDASAEPNYSSSDNTSATPDDTKQSLAIGKKVHVNNGWSAYDLARELQTGDDAMTHIRRRTDFFWMRQWQKRLVSTTKGIYAANLANRYDVDAAVAGTAGDMVYDATNGGLQSAVTDANRFNVDNFTTAAFTMGDMYDDLAAVAVHSTIYARMVKQNDIDFIVDSKGSFSIPTYMGKRVIVDDNMPIYDNGGGANAADYLCVLFGGAAFGFGKATPTVPVEIDRDPRQGHGGGQEELWERKTWLLHPLGWDNDNDTPAGAAGNQVLADLEKATNWTRSVSRKNVPMAFLLVND